jgi:DNA-binding winged helix-turn-helix (wHTH) protein/tetratricopeptide (TPR) repeat protein
VASQPLLKFGPYEVDVSQGELRRQGVRVPLQEKPFRLLAAVVERNGEVVTRAELQQQLWDGEAFGDFDSGLNTAVRKVRRALGDETDSPQYLETIPRRGYRFLAPVERVNEGSPAVEQAVSTEPSPATEKKVASRSLLSRRRLVVVSALVVAGAVTFWLGYSRTVFSFNSRDSVLIADFENQTGDPRFDHALETAFAVSMAQSERLNVFPRARLASVLALMGKPAGEPITPEIAREICQRENIRGLIMLGVTRMGDEYALSAQLENPQTGEVVKSYTQRSYGEGHVLEALDVIVADLRRDLGESLYQIHKNSRPLPEVTTASLAALEQYADGTALWQRARYKDAVTLLRAAVETDPDFAMAHAALGNAYYSYVFNATAKGDEEYQKALALISRTTQRERMSIEASYANSRGHVSEAEQLYRIYLQRYPDDWPMLMSYARLLRMNGNAEQAIAQYKELLRVAPDDARTHVELATAYSTMGDFEQAINAYEQAFQLDPGYINTGNVGREYGVALIADGQMAKAEALFHSQMTDEKMRETGLRSMALLDMYRGQYANARLLLEQALSFDEAQKTELTSVAREHLQLAMLAGGGGDLRAAREQLDAAMENFDTVAPKVALGTMIGSEYARDGFVEQADKIESAVAPLVDIHSPEQLANEHSLQGEIALQHGDKAKAIELFSVAEQEKSSPISMEGLARAYQQSGDRVRAVALYENYVASPKGVLMWEPQQSWLAAHYVLASDDAAKGDRVKARKALDPLMVLWKDADGNLPLHKDAIALNEQLMR